MPVAIGCQNGAVSPHSSQFQVIGRRRDEWVSPPPAVLWDPLMQANGPGFGVHANQFGFNITSRTNLPLPIVVEACTNLTSASWTALQTCTLTNGSIYFSDAAWTNYPCRFYRIRSP